MKKGLIIFDFDGVLADSFDNFFSLIRDGMGSVGLSITLNQYRNLFTGNIHQGFKDFINDKQRYSVFLEFRKNNYDKYNKFGLFPGVVEHLKQLNKIHILTVASSGKQINILNLLKKNNADNLFGLVLATNELTKENMIKEILNKFHAKPEETFFITDTVGDIKVAKKCGLKTIAVTWGFQSAKVLKQTNPDFVATSFREIQEIVS